VDLRSEHERLRLPSQWHGVPSPPTWNGAHCAAAADLASLIQRPLLGLAELREALLGVYRSFPADLGSALAEVFDTLLSGQGGVLVHCAAGKDRTGFVVAMTLRALGVSEEDVLSDYFLTNQVFEEARSRFEEREHIAALERQTPGATQVMLEARGEYLTAADAVIAARWGSIENYLEAVTGLDAARKERLRAMLMEQR
jgi:protein-tyrosine phosphatase